MSKEMNEELIKKYLTADSSLKEEEKLFKAENNNPDLDAWATYVKRNKAEIPNHLSESIWNTIERRKKRKQRYLFGIPTVAASIAVLVTIFINRPSEQPISDEEKWALLTEALTMFEDDTQKEEQQHILYEDDMIVIYTTENK